MQGSTTSSAIIQGSTRTSTPSLDDPEIRPQKLMFPWDSRVTTAASSASKHHMVPTVDTPHPLCYPGGGRVPPGVKITQDLRYNCVRSLQHQWLAPPTSTRSTRRSTQWRLHPASSCSSLIAPFCVICRKLCPFPRILAYSAPRCSLSIRQVCSCFKHFIVTIS